MLTKNDITAIKMADHIVVHLNATHPTGLVRLIQDQTPPVPFARETEHNLPALVTLEGRYTLYPESVTGSSVDCVSHQYVGYEGYNSVRSIMLSLKAGDELSFAFHPDSHSNQYTKDAGLHADVLYLTVRRKDKKVAVWTFDSTICPDNSARMCRNLPATKLGEIAA
jgi:hypothetical protein